MRNVIVGSNSSHIIDNSTSKEKQTSSESIALVAEELDTLLRKISSQSLSGETLSKAEVSVAAVREIKDNKNLRTRVLGAVKQGGIEALKQCLQHPASVFFISALQEFIESH